MTAPDRSPETPAPDAALVLTTAELLAFLVASGLDALPAVDADLPALLRHPTAPARIEAGLALLEARGLAQRQGRRVHFDAQLIALAGSAAHPDALITLERSVGEAPGVPTTLLVTPVFTVALRTGDPGLHLFQPLFSPAAVEAYLADFMLGLCPVDQPPALALRLDGAQTLRTLASALRTQPPEAQTQAQEAQTQAQEEGEGVAAARAALLAAGCPPAEADRFLDDLRTRTSWSVTALTDLRRLASPRLAAVTVVNSAMHCWLLGEGDAPGQLELRAVPAAAAARALRAVCVSALPQPAAAFA